MSIGNLDQSLYGNIHKVNSSPCILLFDLETGGHHSSYIRHLVNYCCDKKLPINLDIVVSPKFIDEHADVVEIPINRNQSQIRFISITGEEYTNLLNAGSLLQKIFREWKLYCQYARVLQATHCLLMYLDTLQLPIALGEQSPCPFSGIYFRPTFHYKDFNNYTFSVKDIFRGWRQKLILYRVLNNPQFHCLFCLDNLASKYIKKLHSPAEIVSLADPVKTYNSEQEKIEVLRQELGIGKDKKIFLLFGKITSRKGIYKLLDAIKILPEEACQKICLLLVGSIVQKDKILVQSQIEAISQSLPIEIITCDKFIAEEQVHLYFQLSDVILAPYQKHVGMSGILLLAAAAKKPVLASNYGLMGQLVRQNKLGIAVDSTSHKAIANSMTYFIDNQKNTGDIFDLKLMNDFVEQNSVDNFSHTLFKNICTEIKADFS